MSAYKSHVWCPSIHPVVILVLATCFSTMVTAQAQQRDPTRPPSQQEVSGSTINKAALALQSVQVSDTDRWAMINGTKVREGEQIGPYRVTTIGLSEVHLEVDGTQVIVRMYESIKHPTSNSTTSQGERQ